MQNLKAKKPADVRFEEVDYQCKCGYKDKEIVPVCENTGVLDVRCPKCSRRILEIRIFDR